MLEWDDNNVHITMAGTTFKPSRSLPNNPQLDGLRVGDKIVMNKIISLIVFVMMFCTLIVVHASAAEPIYDAGLYDFESNWQLIRGTVTDDYEQIYDTNEKYSGGRSIRFSNTTDFESDNGKVLRMNTSSNQRINVKPLTEYTISVWVKTIDFQRLDPNNNSSGAYLDLIGYNADGNISMSDNITLIVVPEGTTDESINNGWINISANITVNENTEYLRIDPRFRNSVGIVWFDNITTELKIYAEHDYYIDATLSTVTVRKNNDKDYETPILIKALYSKEGSLIEIKVLEVDNSLNKGETQVFTDRFKNSTDGNMVKVFIWDDLISMLPLSRVLTWVDDSRVIKNGLIVYEAEDMRLNNDDITIIQDIDASSGIAIKTSALSMADNPAMVENITMGLELEAPSEETGIYAIWIRVKTTSLGNDSVFVKYTGLSNYLIDSGWASQDYYWRKIAIININEGLFRIDFKYREIGFILDKIIMTKDMSFEPTGIDDVPEIPEDGYDENPLYPLPEVNPPEGHPRIFVTSEMLPQIKENIKSDVLSSIYDSVERYAQEELDCVLPEVSSANNYSQGLIYKIQSRAFMYLIGEVNIEHAEQTIKYMRDFYDSLIWDTTTGDITRSMGTTIAASAMVYDWCYDALTEDDKEHLISSMKATAALMEIGYPPTKLSAFIGHGGEGELFYYQLLGGIATYDEDPEMYNLAAGRLFEEYFESREYFNESGNHPEGGFYGMIRYQWEALCQVIFERMGYPDVMGGEMGKPAVKWVYQRLPYGLWIKDGDTPPAYSETGHSYANDDMPLLLYAAVLTKDPYIQSEYIKQLSLRDYKGGSTVYDNGIHTLLLLDPSLEIEYMDEKPLTHVSTYPLSSMTARTSWQSGIEGETAYVFMKAQEKLTDNHNHADIGNFLIYYKGNLAINGGLYHGVNGSYGSNHHINYNQRTISKNCMTVYDPNEIFSTNLESETAQVLANDGGQRYRISVGSFEKYLEMEDQAATKGVYVGPNEITPEFSYIKTDLAKAYSDKVSEYTRSMVAMNLFNDDYPLAFVCFDNMQTSNKDFKKTWNLQSVNEPEITGNTTIIKRNEYGFTGKLVNKTLLPASGQFTITPVGGEGMESYVDGTNYSNPDRLGQVNEQGDWRIEISPTNASQEDIFLNAMYVTDTQKNLPELPMYYEDTSNFAGVTVQDRVVLFSKLRNNVSSQFDLTVRNNGYGKMSVLITDIDTGKWAVSGESISFVTEVNEGENALYINVAPGTYTITPESDMTEVDVFTYPIVDTPKVGDFWVYNTTTSLFHYNDKPTRLVDGVPYVAAKTFFEKLGATVTWNSGDSSTSISFTDSIAIIKENTKEYTLNGNMSELSYEPFIEDGVLYVYPLDLQDLVFGDFIYDSLAKILKVVIK